MRFNINDIIPPLERDVDLSSQEQKALLRYLNTGRFCITFAAALSILLLPGYIAGKEWKKLSDWLDFPLIAWGVFYVAALVQALPLVCVCIKNFHLARIFQAIAERHIMERRAKRILKIACSTKRISQDIRRWIGKTKDAWCGTKLAGGLNKVNECVISISRRGREKVVKKDKDQKKITYSPKSQYYWDKAMVLMSAFWGWNRFYAKAGKKSFHTIAYPTDLFRGDNNEIKEKWVDFFKKKLDSFNDKENVAPTYKSTCYKCLYVAAYLAEIILEEYSISSLESYAQFLKLLGDKYISSASAFKHAKKTELRVFNNIYTCNGFVQMLRDEIEKYKSELKIR